MSTSRWYALATQPRHEKAVAGHLHAGSIEAFLPILKTPSQWKDRKVMIDRPVFPGYVFAHIDLSERKAVYNVPGVVRILSFNGQAAAIEDSEIEAVRICLTRGNHPEPYPFPAVGEKVRVMTGALQGLEGIVSRVKNQYRIVVSISLIHQSVSAEVDADLLEPISTSSSRGQQGWNMIENQTSKLVRQRQFGGNAPSFAEI